MTGRPPRRVRQQASASQSQNTRAIGCFALAMGGLLVACLAALFLGQNIADSLLPAASTAVPGVVGRTPSPVQRIGGLRVAVAPEALSVLQPITTDFNKQGLGSVSLVAMTPGHGGGSARRPTGL